MLRTSYVHCQEDYIVHAALCGMQAVCRVEGRVCSIICWKHAEDKKTINLKSAFCWLKLRNI